MEGDNISFEDWLEMSEDADQLLLQQKLDEVLAETEEYRSMLEILNGMPEASEKDRKTYEDAIRANEWVIDRIQKSQRKLEKEIQNLEDEA